MARDDKTDPVVIVDGPVLSERFGKGYARSIASQLAAVRNGVAALAERTATHRAEQAAINVSLDSLKSDLDTLGIAIDVLRVDEDAADGELLP